MIQLQTSPKLKHLKQSNISNLRSLDVLIGGCPTGRLAPPAATLACQQPPTACVHRLQPRCLSPSGACPVSHPWREILRVSKGDLFHTTASLWKKMSLYFKAQRKKELRMWSFQQAKVKSKDFAAIWWQLRWSCLWFLMSQLVVSLDQPQVDLEHNCEYLNA